jgi:uncharacterized membrane protein AbrB (regulator of aidB expression)
MSLTATLIMLALAAALFGWTIWAECRPRDPLNLNPPLIPRGFLQFAALLAIILMLAHLITLATGKPFTGNRGF